MKRFHLVGIIVLALIFGLSCVALAKNPRQIQTPSCTEGCDFYCAPCAQGPYSQAVQYGEFVFLSGQIALDPCTICPHDAPSGNMAEQTQRVMQNLGAVLSAAGLTFKDVVSSTVYLNNLDYFRDFNAVYERYFSCGGDDCVTLPISGEPFCCSTANDPYCNKNCGKKNQAPPPPARATVKADIPRGGSIEVSMIAGK